MRRIFLVVDEVIGGVLFDVRLKLPYPKMESRKSSHSVSGSLWESKIVLVRMLKVRLQSLHLNLRTPLEVKPNLWIAVLQQCLHSCTPIELSSSTSPVSEMPGCFL